MRILWIMVGLAGCGSITPLYGDGSADTDATSDDDGSDGTDTDAVDTDEEPAEDTDFWDTAPDDPVDPGDTDDPPVDSDSDSDTDGGGGTTQPPAPGAHPQNGTYTGQFKMRYHVPVPLPLIGDNQLCEGSTTVTVDDLADPQVQGTFQCSWIGFLGPASTAGYGPVSGIFYGSLRANNLTRASGSLEGSDGVDFNQTANWTGDFNNNGFSISYDNRILGSGVRGNYAIYR